MPDSIIDLRKKPAETSAPPPAPQPQTETPASSTRESVQHAPSEKGALLTWTALEFLERKKDERTWITRALTVAIPLALIFLFLKNLLGAVVVLLGAFAFLLAAFRKPSTMQFMITDKGVRINEKFTSFRQLKSFWIFTEPETERMLSIRQKGTLQQNLILPLGDTDPQRVKDALLPYLPEEEQEPSAIDTLMRQIGF